MELIIKSTDKASLDKIISLAKDLPVIVEKHGMEDKDIEDRQAKIAWLMNFKATEPSSFGDALEWQREQRKDRDLPFEDR